MSRSLRFFYFGNQCPHNGYLLARIKTLAWKESVKLHLHDVTHDADICDEYAVYSPQMLIVNDRYRLHGPFSSDRILALLEDESTEPSPCDVPQGENAVRGDLVPLTAESSLLTCDTCAGVADTGLCRGKAEWVRDMMAASGQRDLGFLHVVDGSCVGGAEFLPSPLVPYPIPGKRPGHAFLTCVYRTDSENDYKLHPTERLLEDLRVRGFDEVSVVTSVTGVLPNGPASWFERLGFDDDRFLLKEEMHSTELHLLSRRL